jgi:AsmA protein
VKDALSMKKVSLAADIKNGEVNAVLGSDELYSGSGSATLMGGADTKWNSNLTLAGVQVGQLLQALNGSSQISGAANIKAMVSASGNNEAELIGTLSGGGELSLAGGELRGVDLLAMAGGAKALINREATVGSTEFDQATATFTIDRGVISNDDLMVRSGGSSISGKGKLDLPNWRIDYRAIPNLAAGKGAPGVAVPVLITGPLDAPNYTPDAAGIVNNVLADPKAAKEGAKQLRDAVKDNLKDSKGSLKELLKGL